MPFIEDVIEEQKEIWGEYLPTRSAKGLKDRSRSCVKIKNAGTVFVGSVEECQLYIERYEAKKNAEKTKALVTHA